MVYDCIVIGAGPAGSTFARQAARKEKSILMIDGQTELRKKPCGGLLAPDSQRVLAHFDLVLPKKVLADPQIFSVKTIDLCRKSIRYYQRYYLNMDRYAFDEWLLSLIPDTVDIISGRCVKILRQEQGFSVWVRTQEKLEVFQGKRIIGADGASSLVRKTFFNKPIFQYVSIQQWFKRKEESVPFYSCIFDTETSDSCSWMIYKDEYILYGGCFSPKGCKKAFEKQKERVQAFLGYSFGQAEKTEACLVDRPKKFRDFVTGKDGVYLIGEAAGLISASSFEGISSAIQSGSALANALLEQKSEKGIARQYRRKTRKLRIKLYLKTKKRWFMYTPLLRHWIMKTGFGSIRMESDIEKV